MEDENAAKAREEACGHRGPRVVPNDCYNESVCGDELPDDMVALCDWKNPIMTLGSRYKDMVTFRLAMRQYAIKREFELGIEATTPLKYRGYCQGGDCPWKINARVETIGAQTIVVSFVELANFIVPYVV
jgi:hypothetical protein